MPTVANTEFTGFAGFADTDFDAMSVPGLEGRMEAIIGQVRPKLHALGDALTPVVARLTGETAFPHVAKHARRSVNPPDDTWVAWSPSARGYKAFPHFQIGLWSTHLFIQFAIIYECPNKTAFADRATRELASIRSAVPPHYVWSKDHMVPTGSVHGDLTDEELGELFRRLGAVKAAELTCGIHVRRGDPLLASGDALLREAEAVFETLLPLYKMAQA
ncbi:UPF0637 protein [Cohnella xylanilytica]|uniref:UPF0637 protein H7B90_16660 n=1 Tax=Cohnella xylanilytica TaxID=557555 RepID=A0A841TWV5_9BACL|nr:DUF1054 domain-containing protein [Cohnella xylanilytica]MBB6693037.1 DUF1054 domain-containing protein [Cohnella xylanilytica]GIO15588.1 UPF0637 protein [Cohnella xylanilytica]